MTKLEQTLERMARLPPDRREALAVQLEELVEDAEAGEEAPDWHLPVVRARQSGPDDFATDEEADAFFSRHRR